MTQCKASAITIDAMPEHQQDAMTRTLINCIGRLFEDPKVQKDFKNWQDAKKANHQKIKI